MNTSDAQPAPELSILQRWFQAVITHPDGLDAGEAASTAERILPEAAGPGAPGIDAIIAPSSHLSAHDRLSIYANAFHARLVECLGETFPILKRTLGDDVFAGFAMGYLQAYPSRSYTLNELGTQFPHFLGESRPPREGEQPDWADFLIELATLEWTIEQVFDGPGIERTPTLTAERLAAIPSLQWPSLRLATAPCLRLLAMRFPVNEYFSAMRQDEDAVLDMPGPRDTWLVVTRRDYVVRRIDLTLAQFAVLTSLQGGAAVQEAIAAADAWLPQEDADLATELRAWFEQWSAMGLFVEAIEAEDRS